MMMMIMIMMYLIIQHIFNVDHVHFLWILYSNIIFVKGNVKNCIIHRISKQVNKLFIYYLSIYLFVHIYLSIHPFKQTNKQINHPPLPIALLLLSTIFLN